MARRIAALRREAGLTLRQLGEKAGLSDAYLSRVENGQSAVTLASLEKLAEVFGTPVGSFFEEAVAPMPLVICRRGEGTRYRFRSPTGSLAELLASGKKQKLMEPLIVEVGSARGQVELQGHAGEEFNLVLEGRCTFHFGEAKYDLGPGDSVYFDATIPHAVRPLRREHCRILAVVTSSDFRAHADVHKVIDGRIQA